jgi:hypothetical protein
MNIPPVLSFAIANALLKKPKALSGNEGPPSESLEAGEPEGLRLLRVSNSAFCTCIQPLFFAFLLLSKKKSNPPKRATPAKLPMITPAITPISIPGEE